MRKFGLLLKKDHAIKEKHNLKKEQKLNESKYLWRWNDGKSQDKVDIKDKEMY